jgi:hypothetical protein
MGEALSFLISLLVSRHDQLRLTDLRFEALDLRSGFREYIGSVSVASFYFLKQRSVRD